MTKFLCSIWALILNQCLGISIFRTCFANAMEDEDGKPLVTGPPITAFFFACGVYTIVASSSLFPASFRKPKAYLLCIYEFLATAFCLEFSIACIWTPIDILILTTLPETLCNILTGLNTSRAAEIVESTKAPMAMISCLLSVGFFILSLHITKSADFTLLTECGWEYFLDYLKNRLWRKIMSELSYCPSTSRSKGRKSKRSRGRRRSIS